MEFDYRTMISFIAISDFFVAIVFLGFLAVSAIYRKWFSVLFIISRLLQGLAVLGIAYRNIAPNFLSVTIANIILIVAITTEVFSICSYRGALRKQLASVLGGLTLVGSAAFAISANDPAVRSIIWCLTVIAIYGIGTADLFSRRKVFKTPLIIATAFLIYSTILLVRVFYIFNTINIYSFYNFSNIDKIAIIGTLFIIILESLGFLLLFQEIDQQTIMAQKEIIERDNLKLQKSNATKDQLFSIIAHDLRSPLTSLQGILQLVKEGLISKKELSHLMQRLSTDVDNSAHLLDNLLHWAKSQLGQFYIKPEPIAVAEIVEENIALLQKQAQEKQLQINNQVEANAELHADKSVLNLVLRNLLTNALKFTPEGGTVRIYNETKDHHFRLSIRDNGIGMTREQLSQLAEPVIASRKGTAGERGTGLGINICRTLIEKSGGHLDIESELGKGTVFTIVFPY